MAQPSESAPLLLTYFNGTFVPAWDISIEQSVYGTADVTHVTTQLAGSPQYATISQSGRYLPLIIKAGQIGSAQVPTQVCYSYLDEIDTSYKKDEIELSGRGLLAILLDKRISLKSEQNVDIGTAISNVITSYGLQAQVPQAGIDVGKVLQDDFVSMSRNLKAMDYINALAFGVGWRPRVTGNTVIVGPPPDSSPTLTKSATKGDLLDLDIKHSALHAHDIHVKIVSYNRRRKAKINVTLPNAVGSASVGTADSDEEYVLSFPGLDQAACLAKAALIQAELSRHEFIMEMEWAPDPTDIAFLVANGTEFQIQLEDCAQTAHNQIYHPRLINWTWSVGGGLKIRITAVNHAIPLETGGLPNG